MGEWREYKISEIADVIGGGTPKTSIEEYWNGDIPWLAPRDLTGYNKVYISHGDRFITENGLKNSSTKLMPKGSVLLTSRAPIGYIAIAQNKICTNQGFKSLVPKKDICSSEFLYYWIKNNVDYLQQLGTGTTFAEISGSVVKNIDISLPPLKEQKAIAGVLSSLDDKIDLLHRQNKTLESLAQTLFRQWFVEEAKDEWEEKPLSDFGDVVCGKTPSKKKQEYYNGNIPFIKIPDMHGNVFIFNTADTLTEIGSNSQKNKLLPPKSICVSCIATVGLVSMNIIESQTNQQINSIIPKKELFRYFLYLFMKSYYDILHAMASGGTATLNLNTGDFKKMNIVKPDDKTLGEFHNLVEPQFNKIFANQQQIKTLENLRDTLLPKLMSGEVRVKYE